MTGYCSMEKEAVIALCLALFHKEIDKRGGWANERGQKYTFKHDGGTISLTLPAQIVEEERADFVIRKGSYRFYTELRLVERFRTIYVRKNGSGVPTGKKVEFDAETPLYVTDNVAVLYRPEADLEGSKNWRYPSEIALDEWWKSLKPKLIAERLRV